MKQVIVLCVSGLIGFALYSKMYREPLESSSSFKDCNIACFPLVVDVDSFRRDVCACKTTLVIQYHIKKK